MSLQLLLVDDEPGMLETLSDILTSAGYNVTAVNDGEKALEHLQRGGYDLVLMDVRMPGRDGVAVMEESGAPPPPVVLMTAYALEERLQIARAGGAHAVLQKPFAAPHLLTVLAGAVAA